MFPGAAAALAAMLAALSVYATGIIASASTFGALLLVCVPSSLAALIALLAFEPVARDIALRGLRLLPGRSRTTLEQA